MEKSETSSYCEICHDPLEAAGIWKHPATGEEHRICSFCARSIIGVCRVCGEILVSVDRYGVDEGGYKICSGCAARQEMADEASSR